LTATERARYRPLSLSATFSVATVRSPNDDIVDSLARPGCGFQASSRAVAPKRHGRASGWVRRRRMCARPPTRRARFASGRMGRPPTGLGLRLQSLAPTERPYSSACG
jgi:hypothetical protein